MTDIDDETFAMMACGELADTQAELADARAQFAALEDVLRQWRCQISGMLFTHASMHSERGELEHLIEITNEVLGDDRLTGRTDHL